MSLSAVRRAVIATLIAAVVAIPGTALADGWSFQRDLIGFSIGSAYQSPVVSGRWVVFQTKGIVPGATWGLAAIDLRSGAMSTVATSTFDISAPSVDGDWVAYERENDILVKNLATGVVKTVYASTGFDVGRSPVINGKYVAYLVYDGPSDHTHVWVRDYTTMKPAIAISGEPGSQSEAALYGSRVAYVDFAPAASQVMLKTIGSTAPPVSLSTPGLTSDSVSLGDHLAAWRSINGSGHWDIRYFNFDTGQSLSGPSSTAQDMDNPRVSGDRVLYSLYNGSDHDLFAFDVRTDRAAGGGGLWSFTVSATGADETQGSLSQNSFVFMDSSAPAWGQLLVPSLSVGSVPTRVPHKGRITLKGLLSDQGMPIRGATLRIEKFTGGLWTLAKSITTSASGSYSYTTPALTAKTRYRVAYDGHLGIFDSGLRFHLSAVSAVRTGWPR